MNLREVAIIKWYSSEKEWKDITTDIKWIDTIKDEGKKPYLNVTYTSGSAYRDKCENIRWLKSSGKIDIEANVPYNGETAFFDIISALQFEDWVRFFFGDGSVRSYPLKDIRWIKIANKEPNVDNYLKYLADVTRYLEGEQCIIKEQLNGLTVPKDSFLYNAINGIKNKSFGLNKNKLIFPFDFNKSQREAIFHALNNNISLIQGPPGTGKTQTILNIVANILYANKTVAVVSANNEATKNVHEKLASASLDFLTAFIGNFDNTSAFFTRDHAIPEICNEWAKEKIDKKTYEDTISNLVLNNCSSLDLQIKIALLRQKIDNLLCEKSIFETEAEVREKEIAPKLFKRINKHFTLERLLELKAELEVLPDSKLKNFFTRLRFLKRYGIFNILEHFADRENVVMFLTLKQYEMQLEELQNEFEISSSAFANMESEKLDEKIIALSRKLLQTHLHEFITKKFDLTQSNYRTYFQTFLKRYPIVFSTTHSLAKTSGDNFLYDYVIMDEASQVDLASAAIALSRAKNVVLVGDLMQLPNVIRSQSKIDLTNIYKKYNLQPYQNFATHSILDSISIQYKNSAPNTLLDEHYRCDPEIIGFCNKRFYDDKLIIRRGHIKGNGVKITFTEPFHQRSRTNERQVDIINEEIITKLSGEEVGIIAPFKDQVALLKSKIGNACMIDTVHKFQGREKKNIILSTVVNKVNVDVDREEPDFMNNPNLLNVAISRAKDKLYLIVSDELMKQDGAILSDFSRYIKYYCEDGKVEQTSIYSVMDLMYQRYSPKLEEFRRRMRRISKFDSENIIATVIQDICHEKRFGVLDFHINYSLLYVIKTETIQDEDDRKFVANPNTHCDFLLFNKFDKKPCLAVEVDGGHHETKIQKARDERKDRLLREIGIDVVRIKTTSINCKEKIEEALRKCANKPTIS